jgi:hypothetical protein
LIRASIYDIKSFIVQHPSMALGFPASWIGSRFGEEPVFALKP